MTTVLEALGTLLEIDGRSYGRIEAEQLSLGHPLLSADAWVPQLAAVLDLQRRAGRQLFLLSATTETRDELRQVLAVAEVDRTLVVCLTAPSDLLAARIERREPDGWPGKQHLIARARELGRTIPTFEDTDLTIDTEDRVPGSVAEEIASAMKARGLLDV